MLKIHMQSVLVYFQPFRSSSVLKRVKQARNREKFSKILYFGNSMSFKVVDVDTPKKLVISACYPITGCAVVQHCCKGDQPFQRETLKFDSCISQTS